MAHLFSRRSFLKSSAAVAAVGIRRQQVASGFESPGSRPRVAAIGTGSRWCQKATGVNGGYGSAPDFRKYGDYVAVCDADADRRSLAAELVKEWTGVVPAISADYRRLLDRDDIDMVHISTPDHWHAKIAIEAMKAGKDVYCEKPMTLTIEEGRQLCAVCKDTNRIVQIGTQQRSNQNFLKAIALIRAGRIGKLQHVTCSIGGAPASPEIPVAAAPKNLDWNLWLGPAPDTQFRYLAGDNGETKSWSRGHYEFRWWYEYSGGKLTDWGAHHVDIATWAMGKTETGPTGITPVMVKHPVAFERGFPTDNSRYNTATEFLIEVEYADGLKMTIRHDQDNGILFEGTEGRIFVNRGRLSGGPVEALASNPLPEGAIEAVYKNRPLTDHFRNFFEAATERIEPVSDVFSHHRALTTCHLAAIAARLNRPLRWDPVHEKIEGDAEAQSFIARQPRKGFEIEA
ncbi:MAG: Gfo/Idh/MocA family oxidoreductase [Planctomycetaceae bacterium]